MIFNEDSRVKIPCILHLTRLGWEYVSLKKAVWDAKYNIFTNIFTSSLARINPNADKDDIIRTLSDVRMLLDYEDLGKAFYERLTLQSGIKLIDFVNFDNNSFHVVTELPYINGEDEFRPDITLLINGLPLFFIEVKKPNNKSGIQAERDRIIVRSRNKKFRKFFNLTQIMVFSNNMEYDDDSANMLQGAFYAAPSYDSPQYNFFREEEDYPSNLLPPLDESTETFVLKDNNLLAIRTSPEFVTNKYPDSPTNRICTSLFRRDRASWLLRYGFAYVDSYSGVQKHIMRYPQFFASKAIVQKLENGVRKGIIWHTQGSGKTALAYFSTKVLMDYFQSKGIISKFYFIVDRIDLLEQAQTAFRDRGLAVHTIDSREAFAKDIKSRQAVHNHSGKPEITVVNIHKFKDDPSVTATSDYDISVQRVYFLDEVHRSYNPAGSFLANLNLSDQNAIKIGLTGTPLIGTTKSTSIFGEYIHKYYYNASIADGYTLRLIREAIESNYRIRMREALEELEVLQGSADRKYIYAHHKFVKPMLEYIIDDLEQSRVRLNDTSIGGMIICDSSEQAREIYKQFQAIDHETSSVKTSQLILHDEGSKDDRKTWVENFKAGGIDLLIVYNMLLTGFDAHRLKKLYLGRVVRDHGLLQALTRVNRPYKDMRYGYVVDFADIRKEFDATNKAYFEELQRELGDETENYSNLFKTEEEISAEIENIQDVLFRYNTENAELFSQQISDITEEQELAKLRKALTDARSLYNIIRSQGCFEKLGELDFEKLNKLYYEVVNHIALLNLNRQMESGENIHELLNVALEDIVFSFSKTGEEELRIADQLRETLRRTREAFASNFDRDDPEFTSLLAELERMFKKKKLCEVTQEEMTENMDALNALHEKIHKLNQQNELLRQRYDGDCKFVRLHKRIHEQYLPQANERHIFTALSGIKGKTDEYVMNNAHVFSNEGYIERAFIQHVALGFSQGKIALNVDMTRSINGLLAREYLLEYNQGRSGGLFWRP